MDEKVRKWMRLKDFRPPEKKLIVASWKQGDQFYSCSCFSDNLEFIERKLDIYWTYLPEEIEEAI